MTTEELIAAVAAVAAERARCAAVARGLQEPAIGISDPSQEQWDLAFKIAAVIEAGEIP